MAFLSLTVFSLALAVPAAQVPEPQRLTYDHSGLVVDLGVGLWAWPLPMDYDGDGDLLCGNTAGYIGFIENLDGGVAPKWAEPKYLRAGDEVIRIQAGSSGSIQGPCEAKWGYATLSVTDWDGDGLHDVIVNSIWGKVVWFRSVGSRREPRLVEAESIRVEWTAQPPKPVWNWWTPQNGELATQWRTTPCVMDLNNDGLNDLVMLDHEGYLAFFQQARLDGRLVVLPPKHIFRGQDACVYDQAGRAANKESGPLRLNDGSAGKSGRRKFCFADWDGDGRPDLLVNSASINFLRNVAQRDGEFIFRDEGPVSSRRLAGHTTSPTIVDWERDRVPDLLIGAEDGFLYHLKNPRGGEDIASRGGRAG